MTDATGWVEHDHTDLDAGTVRVVAVIRPDITVQEVDGLVVSLVEAFQLADPAAARARAEGEIDGAVRALRMYAEAIEQSSNPLAVVGLDSVAVALRTSAHRIQEAGLTAL